MGDVAGRTPNYEGDKYGRDRGDVVVIDGRRVCRHCRTRPVNRPRGLCVTCYYTPEVLILYPKTVCVYTRRGLGLSSSACYPLPDDPTSAQPGSNEKILVMRERAMRNQSIFHPDDFVDRE